MSGQPKFKLRDTVFALHNELLYSAKVKKISNGDGDKYSYFLHFLGWNARWDRWVIEKEVYADKNGLDTKKEEIKSEELQTDEVTGQIEKTAEESNEDQPDIATLNHKACEERHAAVANSKSDEEHVKTDAKRKRSSSSSEEEYDVTESVENEEYPDSSTEDTSDEVFQVKYQIPMSLKKKMVVDWENVNQEPIQLVPLPRSPHVKDVMKAYVADIRENTKDTKKICQAQDLADSLCLYFDKALPLILLYSRERGQFQAITDLHPDIDYSEMYGVEHLLRLFMKLPSMFTPMSDTEAEKMQAQLIDILGFIQKNVDKFFIRSYIPEAEVITKRARLN